MLRFNTYLIFLLRNLHTKSTRFKLNKITFFSYPCSFTNNHTHTQSRSLTARTTTRLTSMMDENRPSNQKPSK